VNADHPHSAAESVVRETGPRIFVVGARGVPDVEGGAEKNAEKLFPLIAAAGYSVTLAGLSDNIKASEFKGVRLVKAPRSYILKTDKLLYYVAAIFIAARLRPHVVHFQGLGSALFLWAYKLMGMKTVVRYGSADYLVGKWGFLGKLGFLASEFQLRFADAVISVTPALAERLRRRGISANVHVVANAIDIEPAAQSAALGEPAGAPAGPYVLAVGRVTAQKNVDNLIRGFSRFAADNADRHRLVVVGGLDDQAYVDQLRPLLSEQVVLAGRMPRSAIPPLYQRCAVYVNASVHEGSSNAVLEAISAGCAILLSDIPENRDFQLPDHCYFDPLDSSAIAAALKRALANPAAYVADPAKFLTWRDVAERTLGIYDRILSSRRAALAHAAAEPPS
jgi:glycosyltransferase involved in cell wall biosynthesis